MCIMLVFYRSACSSQSSHTDRHAARVWSTEGAVMGYQCLL